MGQALGRRRWAIAEGYIPESSHRPGRAFADPESRTVV